jgi:hypothetical protein
VERRRSHSKKLPERGTAQTKNPLLQSIMADKEVICPVLAVCYKMGRADLQRPQPLKTTP